MRHLKVLVAGALLSTLISCQAGPANDTEQLATLPAELTSCPSDRPDVCTQQYDPVCGYFQPGPDEDGSSSSKEWATESETSNTQHRTFGNACSACVEQDVVGFVRGECTSQKTR